MSAWCSGPCSPKPNKGVWCTRPCSPKPYKGVWCNRPCSPKSMSVLNGAVGLRASGTRASNKKTDLQQTQRVWSWWAPWSMCAHMCETP